MPLQMTLRPTADTFPRHALATSALHFFAARQIPALGLYWGLDGAAHAFYRGLGFATERVYLFFEKPL